MERYIRYRAYHRMQQNETGPPPPALRSWGKLFLAYHRISVPGGGRLVQFCCILGYSYETVVVVGKANVGWFVGFVVCPAELG